MALLHTDSLAATVDACNEALFFDTARCKHARRQVARWIADRVGQPGSYHGLPALLEADFQGSHVLFTGEKVRSDAGRRHILGQEACRVMRMIAVNDDRIDNPNPLAVAALERADATMGGQLDAGAARKDYDEGLYCCGTCSVALWRNLAVGGLARQRQRLAAGVAALKAARDGKGRWARFPYWYTLSALVEMPGRLPLDELAYAAPGCERRLRSRPKDARYDTRRRAVAERALARIA